MPSHKSGDYKLSAVDYYLTEDKSQEDVCKKLKLKRTSNCVSLYTLKKKQIDKMNVSSINENNTFVIIDLCFTDKEKSILEKFSILNTKTYNRYGELSLVKSELPKYLESIGNNNSESIKIISQLIIKIINNFLCSVNKQSAWITIRTSEPNHTFDIPRWHVDGMYFGKRDVPSLKLVTTLKGPSTLLSNSKQKNVRKKIQNTSYGEIMKQLHQELTTAIHNNDKKKILEMQEKISVLRIKSRKEIVEILDKKSITSMSNGKAAIYTVNNSTYGCIHSEPPITEKRIFMSILPGTNEEIFEMEKKRKI